MAIKTDLGLTGSEVLTFGGDSITDAQMYSNYLCAWFQLMYPDLDLNTYVIARSGSSISQWATTDTSGPTFAESYYERYHYPFSPDVVFMMHGQNGGFTAAQHKGHYEDLWNTWVDGTDSAKLVILGMHPVQAATDTKDAEGKADQEAIHAATSASMFHAHTWDEMGAAWIANSDNSIDIRQTSAEPFAGTDTVHPGPAGHIAIAWAVLQGLNAETTVATSTINASTGSEVSSTNCTLSSISMTTNGGTFDRLDTALPWAIDEAGRTNAVALYSGISGWQDYSITVTNLATGTYQITCDGVTLGEATHTELSNGWNMADLTVGPVWEQGQSVLDAIRELHGYDPDDGTELAPGANANTMGDFYDYSTSLYQNGDERGTTYRTNQATQISNMSSNMGAIHTAATPATRTYSLTLLGEGHPKTKRKGRRGLLAA